GVSLNVLHLLAHLVDDGLELEARPRRLGVDRFRAQRVGLPVELLSEEIEAPAGRLARADEIARSRNVRAQALELLLHVGARRQYGCLLVKTAFIEIGA